MEEGGKHLAAFKMEPDVFIEGALYHFCNSRGLDSVAPRIDPPMWA